MPETLPASGKVQHPFLERGSLSASRRQEGLTAWLTVWAEGHQVECAFPQWARAKSCDSFGPVGPAIATGLDWRTLQIRTLLAGRERQNYPVSDMIFSPPAIVSRISREMTLEPGDLIACGTSLGALPMRPGMVVEVVIDGIGILRNKMADKAA